MNRHAFIIVVWISFSIGIVVEIPVWGQGDIGIRVPDGFEVRKFSGDELATNIFSMALDPDGQVVVSGPDYVKTLIDQDHDGRADVAKEFLKLKGGAQGMHFEKQGDTTVLYYVGDGGLWSVSDTASKVRRRILELKTGGEHDSHSIQRGPDGCLYLLCGNGVPIKSEYYNDPDSPVKEPQAGFLMKLGAGGKRNSIIAHGFRNAYDFAFNQQGQIFTFDSDGERDVSLPWYRPTRVFQLNPGDHAGFISASWKRPSNYFDMPLEIGALGRGSPTGVVCYTSNQFPESFHNAIFVADWTFGRIACFQYDSKENQYDRGKEFAVADGQFGFAVTDLAIGSQGDLLVSVGGRGTQGGVYSIRYTGNADSSDRSPDFGMPSSTAGSSEEVQLALADILSDLVESDADSRFDGLRLIGRSGFDSVDPKLSKQFVQWLQERLKQPKRTEFGTLWKILKATSQDQRKALQDRDLHPASRCLLKLAESAESVESGESGESNQVLAERAMFCMEMLTQVEPPWREVVIRCVQLSLGGSGQVEGPAVFHGYQANQPVQLSARQGEFFSQHLCSLLPQCGQGDRKELGRLAAMLPLNSQALMDVVARQINQNSMAVDDIHWLICLAKTDGDGSEATQQVIANTLVQLSEKMKLEALQTDRNWIPRMRSLVKALFEKDGVAQWVVRHVDFGGPQHVFLYQVMPNSIKRLAASRFLEKVKQNPQTVSAEQLLLAATVDPAKSNRLLRPFADRPELADRLIQQLSRRPELADRQLFADGLSSADLKTVKLSAIAMAKLDLAMTPQEKITAFRTACRLGWDGEDVAVRDSLITLLRQGRLPSDRRVQSTDDGYEVQSNARQDESLAWYRNELSSRYPLEFGRLMKMYAIPDLSLRLKRIDWEAGDAKRGSIVFQKMQCAKCHDQGSRLGPSLEGVAKRFSRRDLFQSIVSPDAQVPKRYRALIVETIEGQVFKGTVVYESVDGITLLNHDGESVRINRQDIEQRRMSAKSLMPSGLLDQADDSQWADLYAYLSTL